MKKKHRKKTKWLGLFVFLAIGVLTFPQWIKIFYPLPYYDIVMENASEYQLDPWLVFAVMKAESKFDRRAESIVGASGLMQIMPETAWWISSKLGKDITAEDLKRPDINIELGCWYLAYLGEEFSYNVPVTIAAYNAGHNRVNEWLANAVWDGTLAGIDQIPYPETRQYVKQVLRNLEGYHRYN